MACMVMETNTAATIIATNASIKVNPPLFAESDFKESTPEDAFGRFKYNHNHRSIWLIDLN
ncbi:hypothetical protein AM10699_65580 (plasmid) [Acaryochloris marina MBIC10699]|nr:hypothetical protein AM10699_65580 [Acaryochloris marina MBIC10699]